MQWAPFLLTSIPFLINLYSEKYRRDDLDKTTVELDKDLNLPRIRVYDFILEEELEDVSWQVVYHGQGIVSYYWKQVEHQSQQQLSHCSKAMFLTPPSINHVYKSVPQKFLALEKKGIITRALGKMLGGSTSHNGLMYNRGNPLDFDNWAKISRDDSWKYENVLKYFIRAEDFKGPPRNYTVAALPYQHGRGGPMTVEYEETTYLPYWLQAGREMGYTVADPNGPQRESITPSVVHKKNGKRVSTYTAYIEPIEATRRTLKIHRYSNVTQILFDENKKAYGVTYFRHGFPQIAHASKEITVAGGAVGSPLLLLKSGIGPKDVLDAAKIPQLVDLPVGQNFQDHVTISLRYSLENDTQVFPNLWETVSPSSVQEFFESGSSESLGGQQVFKVSSVAKDRGEHNWPDIQLVIFPSHAPQPNNHTRAFSVSIVLTRPQSRGFISLNSTAWLNGERNDENLAEIDYNLLSEPSDVDVLIEGIQTTLELIENTKTFRSLGAKLLETPLSACVEHSFRSDEYWRCYIAQKGNSWAHLAGTCRMGYGVGDKDAVVDSKLRVIGVSNLRVVDASVMPAVTNANTATPIVMIAEKISAQILNDWARYPPYKNSMTKETNLLGEVYNELN